MKKYLFLLIIVILLNNCYKAKKDWDVIKNSDSIELVEHYLSEYQKSEYFDSALIKMEKLVYKKSIQSKNKKETYSRYEEFIHNYPEIKTLIHEEEKLVFLYRKADSIEIRGKLLDVNNKPVNHITIYIGDFDKSGHFKTTFHSDASGSISGPFGSTDSLGNFRITEHRSFINTNSNYTLAINFIPIETVTGQISIKFDEKTRMIDLGELKIK